MAMTVLQEMTKVMLAVPGADASDAEVAAWYELKARLLEHIAAEGGRGTAEVARQAALARRRSVELRDRAAGRVATVHPIGAHRARRRARSGRAA
jgi:hypothetical protein